MAGPKHNKKPQGILGDNDVVGAMSRICLYKSFTCVRSNVATVQRHEPVTGAAAAVVLQLRWAVPCCSSRVNTRMKPLLPSAGLLCLQNPGARIGVSGLGCGSWPREKLVRLFSHLRSKYW